MPAQLPEAPHKSIRHRVARPLLLGSLLIWAIAGSPLSAQEVSLPPVLGYYELDVNNTVSTPVNVDWSGGGTEAISVAWETFDIPGEAEEGIDYEHASGVLTFLPGEVKKHIVFVVKGDNIPELDEVLGLRLMPSNGAFPGLIEGFHLIQNDDAAAETTVSIAGATVDEGDGMATFEITIDHGPLANAFDLSWRTFEVVGGATPDDFEHTPFDQPLHIPAGQDKAFINVAINDDLEPEPPEAFRVFISATAPGVDIVEANATGVILDNEPPSNAKISVHPASGTEGETIQVPVTLSEAVPFEVNFAVSGYLNNSDPTPQVSVDYAPVYTNHKFDPGETEAWIEIHLLSDTTPEPTEGFDVRITSTDLPVDIAEAPVQIFDATATPTVSIGPASILEGAPGPTRLLHFPVNFSETPSGSVTIKFRTLLSSGPGYADGTDINVVGAGFRQINNPGPSTTVPVEIFPDTSWEPDEVFWVELTEVVGNVELGTQTVAEGTITNDDQPYVDVTGGSLGEGEPGQLTPMTFQFSLSETPSVPIQVQYRTKHIDTNDDDIQPQMASFFMEARTHSISVDIKGDDDVEADERFRVEVVPGAGFADGGSAVGSILDDDEQIVGVTELFVDDAQITEGSSGTQMLRFRISAQGDLSTPSQVDYATRAGTATPEAGAPAGEADYTDVAGTANFSMTASEFWVVVPVLGDLKLEDDETVHLDLSNPSGANVSDNAALGVITNDDVPAPIPTFELTGPAAVDETDSQHGVIYTVRLSEPMPPGDGGKVRYQVRAETATAGEDFVEVLSTELMFEPGQIEKFFTATILGDTEVESDETIHITVDALDGVATGTIRDMLLRLRDDDDPEAPPRVLIADTNIVEGNGTSILQIPISLSEEPSQPITVDWSTEDGQATAGTDYERASGSIVLDSAAGSVLEIPILGDLYEEPTEDFTIELRPPAGALLDVSSVRVVIVDDDAQPDPQEPEPGQTLIRILDVTVVEGDSGRQDAVLEATLVGTPPTDEVSVEYRTVDGSAQTSDGDYEARSGTLRFPAGVSRIQFGVPILGDIRVEGDEAFYLDLSNAAGATLERDRSTVSITDDDAPTQDQPMLGLQAPSRVSESSQRIAVRVTLDQPSTRVVRARVKAVGQTATAGQDFEARTATIEWSAGQSGDRSVRFPIMADQKVEGSETLRIVLESLDPEAAGVDNSSVQVTIVDDDQAFRLTAEETTLVGKTNGKVTPVVKALDDEGRAIEGAIVLWSSEILDIDKAKTASDKNGEARRDFQLPNRPGTLEITARLEDSNKNDSDEVVFHVTVEGALEDLFDEESNPNEDSVAGVLDRTCVDPSGEMQNACEYLYSLEPADQAQAVRAITPSDIAVRGDAALRSQQAQTRNVSARLAQLRSGAKAMAIDGLAFDIQGQGISVGQLSSIGGQPDVKGMISGRVDDQLAKLRKQAGARTETGTEEPATRTAVSNTLEETIDRPFGFFVNGRITVGEHEMTALEPGYDVETRGITAGVDYRIGKSSWVGVAAGYVDSTTDIQNRDGGLDTSGYSLSLYGGYQRGPFWIDGALSHGWLDFDVVREIRLPVAFEGTTLLIAQSTSSSTQSLINLSTGYDFRIGRLETGGFVRGLWAEADIDPYSESEAGGFELQFGGQTIESGLLEAGVELGLPLSVSWGVLHPVARFSVLHELEDNSRQLTGGFVFDVTGDQFRLSTDSPDRDYFRGGLGLQVTLTGSKLLYLMAEQDFSRDDFQETTYSFGYRQQW